MPPHRELTSHETGSPAGIQIMLSRRNKHRLYSDQEAVILKPLAHHHIRAKELFVLERDVSKADTPTVYLTPTHVYLSRPLT